MKSNALSIMEFESTMLKDDDKIKVLDFNFMGGGNGIE